VKGLLDPLGPVAASQQQHLLVVVVLTLVAVLPVLVGVPLIYWRYRRRNAAAYRPDWGFSPLVELMMWGVPLAIVVVLSWLLWQDTHRYAPEKPLGPTPLEIEVVGLNWKWLFLYPGERIASLGDLVIPAGQPVTLKLTSDTVMQSFMVPSLAGQLYAMPGMVTRLNLVASAPGTAVGRNMQYNGSGFSGQQFRVRILSEADYRRWSARAANSPVRLDKSTYNKLAGSGSLAEATAIFSGEAGHRRPFPVPVEDANLFGKIVGRYHTGTPIAPEQQPGASAYTPVDDRL
jgi:cytochrome o ubiquinol oxidase subunit II